jgi:hypothetical protein
VRAGPEDIALFELNYCNSVQPISRRIMAGWGWAQCTNRTPDFLSVYGPKPRDDRSDLDTSLYVLPPHTMTPRFWDCKGFLLPVDRVLRSRWCERWGPLAVKFWGFRRFWVKSVDANMYASSWNNGLFKPGQINWPIPTISYDEIRLHIE